MSENPAPPVETPPADPAPVDLVQPPEPPADPGPFDGLINPDLTFADGWADKLGEGFEHLRAHAAKYKDLKSVLESDRNLFQKLSQREEGMVKIPTEDSTDEEKAAWNKARGIPDKYEIKLNDDVAKEFELPEESQKEYIELAESLGLTQDQLTGMIEADMKRAVAATGDAEQARVDGLREAEKTLRDKWGGRYDHNIDMARKVAAKYALEAGSQLLTTAEGIELLSQVGADISEDRLPGSEVLNAVLGPESQADDIRSNESNPDHEAFWKETHPRHEEVVKKVLELEAKATKGRSASLRTVTLLEGEPV